MNTRQFYYTHPYDTELEAEVLTCTPAKGGFLVTFNENLFYPTGGGQPHDLGTAGDASVLDVNEKGSDILVLLDAPLTPGEKVLCKLDWPRRFMLMQQHSGEHLVSGVVHRRFGYDNVGFHMGIEAITIDFSGELTADDLREVEAEVNEAVWKDLPAKIYCPSPEELKNIPYRSKRALEGEVRIVEFPGVDICACCGLHVRRTGEIGLVKLLSVTGFHEGVRVELLCGGRALQCLSSAWEENHRVSAILSAKPEETGAAAERMAEELKQTQYRCCQLENRLFARIADEQAGAGNVLHFEEGLSPDGVRRLCDALLHKCGGIAAVFSRRDEGFLYALGTEQGDLRPLVRELNSALHGRGGGKPCFAQGSVQASRKEISAFFKAR